MGSTTSDDVLMMYDPFDVEAHCDSTEFEDALPELENTKSRKKITKKRKKSPQNTEKMEKEQKKARTLTLDHSTHKDIKMTPSKWSLIKQKVMSITSLFGKHNKMDALKETRAGNIEIYTCTPYCVRCDLGRDKKGRRETRPIYYTKENIHAPFQVTAGKIVQAPLQSDGTIQGPWSTSLTSLSQEYETQKCSNLPDTTRRLKAEKDINITQINQFPSANEAYRFICSECSEKKPQSSRLDKNIDCRNISAEYLNNVFHDVQKKYQPSRTEDDFCVHNCSHYKSPEPPPTCCRTNRKSNPSPALPPLPPLPQPGSKKKISDVKCQCYPEKGKSRSSSPATQGLKLQQKPSQPPMTEFCGSPTCPDANQQTQAPPSQDSCCPPTCPENKFNCHPCQQPHEDTTKAVQNKYAGEILCIHNPPCVLINGCLNLPSYSPEGVEVYTATNKKGAFYDVCRKIRGKAKTYEQSCQHQPSNYIQECQTSIYTVDKVMQSTCNHNPPCEIVPICLRPRAADDSYIQLGLCPKSINYHQKILAHSMEQQNLEQVRDDKSCECRGKSMETDRKRRLIQLTAKENIYTQVKPKHDPSDNYCLHVPPCQKLPESTHMKNSPQAKPTSSEQRLNCSETPINTMDYVDLPDRDNYSPFENSLCSPKHEDYSYISSIPKYANDKKGLKELRTILDRHKWTESQMSVNNLAVFPVKQNMSTLAKSSRSNSDEINCVHVPMCQKVPKCVKHKHRKKNADPKTKSNENNKKHYISLTARDDASVQAMAGSRLLCRHYPQCVKIPRCLGQAMKQNVIPFEDIPDCTHRPFCELIPACCRKSLKEMASVGSQYPASCRIS